MPASYPSIQSFFQKEVHPNSSSPLREKETSHAIFNSRSLSKGDDGFSRDGDGGGGGMGSEDGDGDGFTVGFGGGGLMGGEMDGINNRLIFRR